jgi:hypothetical protein
MCDDCAIQDLMAERDMLKSTISNKNWIGKQILLDRLCDQFYTYERTYPETLETPEEGIWRCNICNAEWGDGHSRRCSKAEVIEAIWDFIFGVTINEEIINAKS